MAEVDTIQLSQEHGAIRHDIAVESARLGASLAAEVCATNKHIGDARREQAEIGANSAYQNGTQHAGIVDAVKSSGWANSDRTGTEADRLSAQGTAYFVAQQQNDFSNATSVAALKAATDLSFANTLNAINTQGALGQAATALEGAKNAAAVALAAEKIAAAQALASAGISRDIVADGNTTRALINDLKYHDLNRGLVERNTALVSCEQDRDNWRFRYDDARSLQRQDQFAAQFAQLQTQVQAFASQLQETRQGMVNFGTMAGVGQSSTSNNVR